MHPLECAWVTVPGPDAGGDGAADDAGDGGAGGGGDGPEEAGASADARICTTPS